MRTTCAVLALLALTSCATGGGPKESCLAFEASPQLNYYASQPHPLVVFLYPLSNELGFKETDVEALLRGQNPPGMSGPRLQKTLTPSQVLEQKESFPNNTVAIGLVANYYREAGEVPGQRKAIVQARCGFRAPRVLLGDRELSIP